MSEPLDALLDQAYSRGLNDALRQMRAIDLAANTHTLDLDSPEADLRTRIEALLDRWQAGQDHEDARTADGPLGLLRSFSLLAAEGGRRRWSPPEEPPVVRASVSLPLEGHKEFA